MSREINIMVSVAPENGLQTTRILCKGIKFYDIVNFGDLKLWVNDPPQVLIQEGPGPPLDPRF